MLKYFVKFPYIEIVDSKKSSVVYNIESNVIIFINDYEKLILLNCNEFNLFEISTITKIEIRTIIKYAKNLSENGCGVFVPKYLYKKNNLTISEPLYALTLLETLEVEFSLKTYDFIQSNISNFVSFGLSYIKFIIKDCYWPTVDQIANLDFFNIVFEIKNIEDLVENYEDYFKYGLKVIILKNDFKIDNYENKLKDKRIVIWNTKLKLFLNKTTYFTAKKYNLYFYKRIILSSDLGVFYPILNIYKHFNTFQELIETIENSDFKALQKLSKNEIYECNKCIFRYMCYDSRIPIFNDEINQYKHTSKCELFKEI
ncbi:MAG: hypothetical protein IPM42_21070 [Saprospiraceae bacterium]|nr:hypothetical protein [Saprospiraceae bacterium]